MADPSGRLNIRLQRRDDRVVATIRSSRPTAAGRVFAGKTVWETASGLPALFGVCAAAQACACASACEAALGLGAPPAIIRLRRLLVDAETVKEHLWRMLFDWPRFLDQPPLETAMSKVMGTWLRLRTLLAGSMDFSASGADPLRVDVSSARLALDGLARMSEEPVFGVPPTDWLARIRTREELCTWAESTDTASAGLIRRVQAQSWGSVGDNKITALPHLRARDLDALLSGADVDRFVAEPLWGGKPRESSPFTRQRERAPVAVLTQATGNGLLPRLSAQLVELATLQQSLYICLEHLDEPVEPLAAATEKGVGIAQVPAARGLLVHRVEVDRGRIRDYRILAPTEWNFHPRGVVARGLSTLSPVDTDTLERQARLFVTAVDPCVDYHLTID
jgi:hypothetical protein